MPSLLIVNFFIKKCLNVNSGITIKINVLLTITLKNDSNILLWHFYSFNFYLETIGSSKIIFYSPLQ